MGNDDFIKDFTKFITILKNNYFFNDHIVFQNSNAIGLFLLTKYNIKNLIAHVGCNHTNKSHNKYNVCLIFHV